MLELYSLLWLRRWTHNHVQDVGINNSPISKKTIVTKSKLSALISKGKNNCLKQKTIFIKDKQLVVMDLYSIRLSRPTTYERTGIHVSSLPKTWCDTWNESQNSNWSWVPVTKSIIASSEKNLMTIKSMYEISLAEGPKNSKTKYD